MDSTPGRLAMALCRYRDDVEMLLDDLGTLAGEGPAAVRGCQVQLEQLVRDLRSDVLRRSVRIAPMTDDEAQWLVQAARAVLSEIQELPNEPDASWIDGLDGARAVIESMLHARRERGGGNRSPRSELN
jgi:hypothetical protein